MELREGSLKSKVREDVEAVTCRRESKEGRTPTACQKTKSNLLLAKIQRCFVIDRLVPEATCPGLARVKSFSNRHTNSDHLQRYGVDGRFSISTLAL
ncbi:hypothetical protein ONS95_010475 [Cadophora gregata]|uniref:uncharacterized protein n=1 Tax=Cadophora gregata TaxID=51156 RepID=UPI0026DC24DA|nr:uncharacterized protein ONS95_010475 [Cadophora gregata]KAK0122220.1 hypothetical protein ONS95_010475 [Cadophora gregata]KAK0127698.1 hypothetical protein ONS96_007216 [Cadophora gregata f. sp. sojae]